MADEKEIKRLIQMLGNDDHDVWNRAEKKLIKIGKPAIPYVIDILVKSEDELKEFARDTTVETWVIRESARDILIEIGHDPLTVSKMIEALKNEDSFVRYAAACILGEMGDRSAIPYLFNGLNDIEYTDGDLDIAAARALGNLGDVSAVPYLLRELKKNHPDTHYAIKELVKLVPKLTEEGRYTTALEVIKECTASLMEYYRWEIKKFKKNRRSALKFRRIELVKLESLAQKIHDKMNPDKKRFPVKHQPVRAVKRKVIHNG